MDQKKPAARSPIKVSPIKPIVRPEEISSDGQSSVVMGGPTAGGFNNTLPANTATVGAIGSNAGQIQAQAPAGQVNDNPAREYFHISSPEFKAFWGQRVSSLWFAPKKRFTLPYLILSLTTVFIVYLSSLLLFSPMEIFKMINYQASPVKIDQQRIENMLSKYRSMPATETMTEESTISSDNTKDAAKKVTEKKKRN